MIFPLTVQAMTSPHNHRPADRCAASGGISTPLTRLRVGIFSSADSVIRASRGRPCGSAQTETFIVILANRVHPEGKGDVTRLRAVIANIVAQSRHYRRAGD